MREHRLLQHVKACGPLGHSEMLDWVDGNETIGTTAAGAMIKRMVKAGCLSKKGGKGGKYSVTGITPIAHIKAKRGAGEL